MRSGISSLSLTVKNSGVSIQTFRIFDGRCGHLLRDACIHSAQIDLGNGVERGYDTRKELEPSISS